MTRGEGAPDYFAVGTIVGAHGVRGELKVVLLTDYPERFAPGATLLLESDSGLAPVVIASARPHKGMVLVTLASVSTRTAAELLRGRKFMIPEDQAMPLGEHENYLHDLIGLSVETPAGEILGELVEVLLGPANDVYVVAGAHGQLLLPALRSVVLDVDLEHGRMVVEVPEGLRD